MRNIAVLLLVSAVAYALPNSREIDIGSSEAVEEKEFSVRNADIGDAAAVEEKEFEVPEDLEKRFTWSTYTESSAEATDYSSEGGTGKAGGCTRKYKNLQNSTMCAFNDDDACTVLGLSSEQIELLVKLHNDYRAKIRAKDMQKLYFDFNIAKIAQKLAQSCIYTHDSSENRLVPDTMTRCGQNLCKGTNDLALCVKMWYDEINDFTYGASDNLEKSGHFTQLASSQVTAIGCGFAYCKGSIGGYLVCNYNHEQTIWDVERPYDKGSKCANCPNNCKNNLCDCEDKKCYNNGKLDGDCNCKCPKPYTGTNCERADCAAEMKDCGNDPYVASSCAHSNLQEFCPRLCGVPC